MMPLRHAIIDDAVTMPPRCRLRHIAYHAISLLLMLSAITTLRHAITDYADGAISLYATMLF